MKQHIALRIFFFLFIVALAFQSSSQCQQYAEKCSYLLEPFRSDGQFHRALLKEGETAEFVTTFYKGNIYRIVSCTGPNSDTLIFRVLDANYQQIYTNEDFGMQAYWDFKFNATDKYYIQGELKQGAGSGCAVILIGFKE